MTRTLTFHHSADADDLFMMYGIACGAIRSERLVVALEANDIEQLNLGASEGKLECTAASAHAFVYLNHLYRISDSGSSFGGKEYGPRVVARSGTTWGDVQKIAIPGLRTSAALTLKMYLQSHGIRTELKVVPFHEIQGAVSSGSVDAGVVIHEGQITHYREGLHTIADLGAWWWTEHGLPLPLGLTIVARSLGAEMEEVVRILRESISYGLAHRDEALAYAESKSRGLTRAELDQYVSMYVNEKSVSMGQEGRAALERFYSVAFELGFIEAVPPLDIAVGE